MEPLTKEQLTACQHRLNNRQSKLIEQMKGRFDLEISQTDAIGELSSYDNHPADLGTELFERGKDLALYDHAEKELEAINKSLHALAEGTYGICRVCSMPIPYERLVSHPTAETCVEHADSDKVDVTRRPIEEEVMHSDINLASEPPEEYNAYDREDAWQDVSRYGSSDTPSDLFGDQADAEDTYVNSDEDIGIVEEVERYEDHQDSLS